MSRTRQRRDARAGRHAGGGPIGAARRPGSVTSPGLRDQVAGDGRPARYARVVALGASEKLPLIVGELEVTAM